MANIDHTGYRVAMFAWSYT